MTIIKHKSQGSPVEHNHDWLVEERNHEMTRLQSIIENPQATNDERSVAKDMLAMYKPWEVGEFKS